MKTTRCVFFATIAVAGLLAAAPTQPADAASACFNKAGQGTNTTEKGAQFQAFEAILQATDWGMWAAYMASGNTPGYKISKVKYKCKAGGIGHECIGQARICKQ